MSRLEALQAMLKKNPTDALLLYMLGKQYRECVTAMERYFSLTEDEGAAYRTLAQALAKLGKISEAHQAYTAGIRAAQKFEHPSMVEEYEETLKTLE
jgi:predicted Zn-dependent protease